MAYNRGEFDKIVKGLTASQPGHFELLGQDFQQVVESRARHAGMLAIAAEPYLRASREDAIVNYMTAREAAIEQLQELVGDGVSPSASDIYLAAQQNDFGVTVRPEDISDIVDEIMPGADYDVREYYDE